MSSAFISQLRSLRVVRVSSHDSVTILVVWPWVWGGFFALEIQKISEIFKDLMHLSALKFSLTRLDFEKKWLKITLLRYHVNELIGHYVLFSHNLIFRNQLKWIFGLKFDIYCFGKIIPYLWKNARISWGVQWTLNLGRGGTFQKRRFVLNEMT